MFGICSHHLAPFSMQRIKARLHALSICLQVRDSKQKFVQDPWVGQAAHFQISKAVNSTLHQHSRNSGCYYCHISCGAAGLHWPERGFCFSLHQRHSSIHYFQRLLRRNSMFGYMWCFHAHLLHASHLLRRSKSVSQVTQPCVIAALSSGACKHLGTTPKRTGWGDDAVKKVWREPGQDCECQEVRATDPAHPFSIQLFKQNETNCQT